MSDLLSLWLRDTFLFTGMLIALVLLVRKPVSRWFGPQVAYALWLLPLLRFVLPPVVLPASMATESEAATQEVLLVVLDPVMQSGAASTPSFDFTPLLLVLWLGGALAFLIIRARNYRRMRDSLLAPALPVGEIGAIRMVETPAVSAPIAFGIFDKVIALPPEFMAQHDLAARDLAIAHELAHHKGHDLLANVAAQPLLALHWFNPLAWWGWRAMRRDQEAACDARVVAGRGKSERAVYAQVIAGFAAGDDFVLAAPMACRVLGEKSIIHRLRSLTMSEVSTSRRRSGMAALAAAALALPFTASVAYADADNQAAAPEPPAAPRATAGLAPQADGRQSASEAPPAPDVTHGDSDASEAPAAPHVVKTIVHKTIRKGDGPLDEAEIAELRAEIEKEMEQIRGAEKRAMVVAIEADRVRERAEAARERAHEMAKAFALDVDADVNCDADEPVAMKQLKDGRRAMVICRSLVHKQAQSGLRSARDAIAASKDIPAAKRDEILRSLDEAIREMEATKREAASVMFTAPIRIEAVRQLALPAVPTIRRLSPEAIEASSLRMDSSNLREAKTCPSEARSRAAIA